MEALQTRRFKEQTRDILENLSTQTLKFEDNFVTSAKINTTEKLNAGKINALLYMASSWCFDDIEISRSGAGLKIEFSKFNKQKVLALNT